LASFDGRVGVIEGKFEAIEKEIGAMKINFETSWSIFGTY
jgi:hypothetical protein